ncbi:hypothetical protein Sango_3056000 [Sesamum angolense]|uniref:DUF4283 domain-containing protein n=1 Tax=Sesamum angolense TaxID=2727404 RepID=A0AAE1T952_9LAMI|nr:hypothetical protein Sango_3056000 [Sesamum angolense]
MLPNSPNSLSSLTHTTHTPPSVSHTPAASQVENLDGATEDDEAVHPGGDSEIPEDSPCNLNGDFDFDEFYVLATRVLNGDSDSLTSLKALKARWELKFKTRSLKPVIGRPSTPFRPKISLLPRRFIRTDLATPSVENSTFLGGDSRSSELETHRSSPQSSPASKEQVPQEAQLGDLLFSAVGPTAGPDAQDQVPQEDAIPQDGDVPTPLGDLVDLAKEDRDIGSHRLNHDCSPNLVTAPTPKVHDEHSAHPDIYIGKVKLQTGVVDNIAGAFLQSSRKTLHFVPPTKQNGEIIIRPTKEVVDNGSKKWQTTAVGYCLGRRPYFPQLEAFARANWKGLQQVSATSSGFFFFRFTTRFAMEDVIEGGPWLFQGQPIVLQFWEQGMSLRRQKHTQIPVWIRLRHLPMEYWTEEGLSTIASGIGTPLYTDVLLCGMVKRTQNGLTLNMSGCLNGVRIVVHWGMWHHLVRRTQKRFPIFVKKQSATVNPVQPAMESAGPEATTVCKNSAPVLGKGKELILYNSYGALAVDGDDSQLAGPNICSPTVVNVQRVRRNLLLNWSWFDDYSGPEGRIWLAWNPLEVGVDIIRVESQFVHCRAFNKRLHTRCLITVLYGAYDLIPRRNLWSALCNLSAAISNEPWLVLGDFNAVMDDSEVYGRAADTSVSMTEFRNCIRDSGLVQLPFTGCPFTWHNCSEGPRSLWKRLDRMLANTTWMDAWPNYSYISALPSTSDFSSYSYWYGQRQQKRLKGNLTDNVRQAKNFLDKAQALFTTYKEDIFLDLVKSCRRVYSVAVKLELSMLQQRAKLRWLKHGDQSSKIFFRKINATRAKQRIFQITKGIDLEFLRHELKHTITTAEASLLVTPVTLSEVKNAFFDIDVESAPGPDGYTSAFYRNAWPVIGQTLFQAVDEFFRTGRMLKQINTTLISLIPKVSLPRYVSDYRPIACCNVLYKSISKIIVKRLQQVLPLLIDYSQNAFVPGRSITDNILLAQELLAVSLNGSIHGFFKGGRGLRQGDPMSPYLFVLVMEIWNLLLKFRIKEAADFQYHWKLISDTLNEFAALSGLKVNPAKSQIIFSRAVQQERQQILDYLGPLIDKVDARLAGWNNQILSYAGRLQLIKSVLSTLHTYWTSAFILPKGVLKTLEKKMRQFLWQGSAGREMRRMTALRYGWIGFNDTGSDTRQSGHSMDPWHERGPLCFIFPQGPEAIGLPLSSPLSSVIRRHQWCWPALTDTEFIGLTSQLPPLHSSAVDSISWRSSLGKFTVSAAVSLLQPTTPRVLWRKIRFQWPFLEWQTGLIWASKKWRGSHLINAAFRATLAALVYHLWAERNNKNLQQLRHRLNTSLAEC